ncbi:molybdopterin-containing oxidoreductase family protein [Solidesulfovibrio sp.]|uniref:molybdopterin-containing oxidoreductase family protein n=1 Tax=Solidesulfovibrio sp. TaxID=2910990 RepID=UPI002B20950F|nr:molybdopterin-dependent oxidoreductase [Solidesulfovibrio sp.]MEA4855848.1 molybdopterin-dependent oxidoreductase [Solidesulfovibrio sp.]
MTRKQVYSVCGLCTVRCPMMATVAGNRIVHLQGNPHAAGIKGALCARGAAGAALIADDERPQFPMIRAGERGEGKWRKVSWDEALAHVAGELARIRQTHGARSILLSDRGGPFRDMHRAFLRALGSPNYCNHDSACARNVQHAALSLFGFGRKDVAYDYKNSKHVVLQTRNIFEAINVKEVNDLLDAKEAGCKITSIDVRTTVTAAKADTFLMVRPGTDYVLNLAVIHELLARDLYDKDFAAAWIKDLEALKNFVAPYTAAYAAAETGLPAARITALAEQLAAAAPAVIWHPGWMTARYGDSFHVCRSAYIINALLGAIGAKGGLPLVNGPGHVGKKGLKNLVDLFPKPGDKRVDGVGWMEGRTHFDTGPGLVNLAYEAIETGEPYPIRAYIAHRHDPLMAFPDTADLKRRWKNLELLVSVTFSWSDTAWFSDVVLPMSPYLERESLIATKKGVSPSLFVRRRALTPRFDTRADWEIYRDLARAMGIQELDFASIEDIWAYQLADTGLTMADFEATGLVKLGGPLYRPVDGKTFKTASGKIELVNPKLEADGLASLAPYVSPAAPPEGRFRVSFGRVGLHTQGHTVNNPLLFAQMPENELWINTDAAAKLGIADGDVVEVAGGAHSGKIKAKVTEGIHPETVFMVHGFGHTLPVESRARGRGLADNELMPGGIANWDKGGGGVCMQEHFVGVRPV